MEAGDIGIEGRVHFYAVAVELQFWGVEKGFNGSEPWNDMIHRLNKIDNVDHSPVGHGGRDVTGHGVGECRPQVGPGQFLLPSPLSIENIAKALHENMSGAQHIGQLSDLLGIGDGLMKGLIEIVGAENC